MRIAVVDDEPLICDLLTHYILKWQQAKSVTCEIDTYKSAEAFSFEWETSRVYDIVFLDIEMPGANGLILAKQIRAIDQWLRIVFVTGTPDYVFEGYEVRALNYLLKPISPDKIATCLDCAYEAIEKDKINDTQKMLVFKMEDTIQRESHQNIIYVEARQHAVRLQTIHKELDLKMSFKMMVSELAGSTFITCHRSYLVNLEHIEALDQNTVYLEGKHRVPLSRLQAKKVHQAFIAFHKKKERNL